MVRIGRVQEEEEAMCSSTSGLLPALWLPAHRTGILDKSGTIAVPPINLLDRLISLPHNYKAEILENQRSSPAPTRGS